MRLKKVPEEKLSQLCKVQNPNISKKKFKETEYEMLHHLSGTYLFIVKRDFEIDRKTFMKEVTGKFQDYRDKTYEIEVGVPPCNFSGRKIMCKRGEVLYIGSARDIYSRVGQHLFSDSITKNVSLKLGFKTRRYVKKYIDIYYTENVDDEKKMRKEYGCIIGR